MNIYFLLMLLTFFLALHSCRRSQKVQNKCLWIVCFLWTLVWGLRGYGVGNDTPGYAEYFDGTGTKFVGYGTVDAPGDTMEPGFIIIGKFLSIFSSSPTFYFLVVAALQFSAIYYLYKDKKVALWGFLFFFIVGLGYEAAIVATRQSLSLSLVLWAVYLFETSNISELKFSVLKKNKRVLFGVALFIFALFTHRTSILIFPVLILIYFWKLNKKTAYIVVSLIFLITLVIPNSIKTIIDLSLSQISLFANESINLLGSRYENTFDSNITLMKIILWALPVYTCLYYTPKDKINSFTFKCLIVSIALNLLLTGTSMIERLSITFTILGFRSFVPVEVTRNKRIVMIFILSTVLFLARTYKGFALWDTKADSFVPYYFFWEK